MNVSQYAFQPFLNQLTHNFLKFSPQPSFIHFFYSTSRATAMQNVDMFMNSWMTANQRGYSHTSPFLIGLDRNMGYWEMSSVWNFFFSPSSNGWDFKNFARRAIEKSGHI